MGFQFFAEPVQGAAESFGGGVLRRAKGLGDSGDGLILEEAPGNQFAIRCRKVVKGGIQLGEYPSFFRPGVRFTTVVKGRGVSFMMSASLFGAMEIQHHVAGHFQQPRACAIVGDGGVFFCGDEEDGLRDVFRRG